MNRHYAGLIVLVTLAFSTCNSAVAQAVYSPGQDASYQYHPYAGQVQNDQSLGVQTYWALRNYGALQRERERGMHPTPEEFARRARAATPAALTATQIDFATGTLYWPDALQDEDFEAHRRVIDEQMAKWARYGSLDYAGKAEMRQKIDTIFDILKSQISSIPPQEYIASRAFLQSLLFATTRSFL